MEDAPAGGEESRARVAGPSLAVVLWGAALGLGAGVALSIALARPAGAVTVASPAALPQTPSTQVPPSPTGVGSVTGAGTDQLANPSFHGTTPAPPSSPTSLRDGLTGIARNMTTPDRSQLSTLLGSIAPLGPINAVAAGLGPTTGEGSESAPAHPGAQVSLDLKGSVDRSPPRLARNSGASRSPRAEVAVPDRRDAPTSPPQSPVVPWPSRALAMATGSHPIEGLPPTALLLPVLFATGFVLSRRRAPGLLFDARSAPPG